MCEAATALGFDQLPAVRGRLERLAEFLRLAPSDASVEQKIRAARELGLHRRDPVVRRVLAEAMRQHVRASVEVQPVTQAEVRDYLATHADSFLALRRFTIRHAYVGGPGDASRQRAAVLGRRWHDDPAARARVVADGDVFYPGHSLPPLREAELARRFGEDFATAVSALAPGIHPEPLESAYGWHVVELIAVQEPKPLPTATAAARARRTLERVARDEAARSEIAALVERGGAAS